MIKTSFYHLLDEAKEHWRDYVVLFLGLLLGLGAFVFFSGQILSRELIVFGLALFYFFWGVIHHAFRKDLHFKVALEYLLISLLGLIVFFSLIRRL